MDRLTIRNGDGSVSQPTDLRWTEALNKLAAYEDTGLSPEEVEVLFHRSKRDNVVIPDITLFGKPLEHWDKLNKAEAEGRLVELPCKVGDELWFEKNGQIQCETVDRITADQTDEDDDRYISIYTMSVSVLSEDIGRLIFLTREEAEKALEAKNG